MNGEETFVAGTVNAFKANLERADKLFAGLTAEGLLKEVAPGRNRLIYLWGHLTATHDRMIELLGLGERLHPEFDALFLGAADKTLELPSAEEMKKAWDAANGRLLKGLATLSVSDWLKKHGAVSDEDFAKEPLRNRFSILLSRANHLSYHLGQAVLGNK
jgi:hypothetical protein